MPEIEKYVDSVKNRTLYEMRNQDNLPHDILSEWATNSRTHEKMARRFMATQQLLSTFDGVFKGMFEDIMPTVVTMYRSVDGWSVMQAIAAEGQKAVKEQVEEKKKGLLGLGSNKNEK